MRKTLSALTLIIAAGLTVSVASAQGTIIRTHANGKQVAIPTCTTMQCCKHNRTVLLGKPWTASAKAYCDDIVARYGR